MRAEYTKRFRVSYGNAPAKIQLATDRKLEFLLGNIRHPSLHAKKYDEKRGVWQARVTDNWRFYFQIEGDTYKLIDVILHPK